jgi:hypothetical protein
MTNGKDSAFAHVTEFGTHHPGLTKREYFAATILSGLLSDSGVCTDLNLTDTAVEFADHLIASLNQEAK